MSTDELGQVAGTDATAVDPPRAATGHRRVEDHRVFVVLLVLGVAVRVLMLLAFHPTGRGGDAVVALVGLQQLAGLITATAVYVVVLRWGAWRWLAAVAAAPALFDDRVLRGEQSVGAAAVVGLLVTLVVVALCWRARPRREHLLAAAGFAAAATALLVTSEVRLTGLVELVPRTGVVHDTVGGLLDLTVPGPLLLAGLLLGLAGAVGLGRARDSGMQVACALVAAAPLLAVVVTMGRLSMTWLDALPAVTWWPAAGALGLTAVLRGRRGRAARRAQVDAVDLDAHREFRRRYDSPRLGPVVIVIAAYNEADGLPTVLATLPDHVCGLTTDVLVVDDGSSDGTAAALEGTRAFAVTCPVNRGQGAALRLGYSLAREHGARYLITTDADGQYDVADFPAVLAPLLDGRADFVTGSRILGRQHTHDRVRRLGVHVFAWIASAFAGRRLTDTSFGLRAMRAEVPAAVTLNQPQYQSSELLLGVLSHGFEVLEVPATMHVRSAGSSKKGRNLAYGSRYARVVIGTWWREGALSPAPARAAALREERPGAL